MHLADIGTLLLIAFAVCFFLLRWLLRGRLAKMTLDQPNHRSLHVVPTPRIGGLGVLAGILGGSAALFAIDGELSHRLWLLLGLLVLLSGFCFVDDRRGLSAAIRLPVHLVVAFAWVAGLQKLGAYETTVLQGGQAINTLLAVADGNTANVLWLAGLAFTLGWMMNLYNFMDGSNGLAGGMAVFGFGAYGVAAWLAGQPELAALAFVVAAAALAFLIFNFDPARVFLGDVGSIPLGFLAGAMGLWGWQTTAWPAWFPLLVFSPFIVDATVTLARRGLRGEKVWQAHHDHAYQRLIRSGWSHRQLAIKAYGLMASCALSALVLRFATPTLLVFGLVLWGGIYLFLLWFINQHWGKSRHKTKSAQNKPTS
jgi:UDP-N-acetylmuramyl pentapeptide phosphotransferase/UDP-N-acetylglucosamine-1-phosphate transferase